MTGEIVYRLSALAISVTYMTTRSVFEAKLGRGTKAAQFKQLDPDSRLELIVVSWGVTPQWLYLLTPLLDFAAIGLPAWIRWAGAAVALAGLGLFFWTHRELAGNWSPAVESARAGTLITSGPYRWARHPMYTSFFLYNIGLLLLMSNWLAGLPPLLSFGWMYFHRVRREERIMLEQFGQEYVDYASKTGRVVPVIGRRQLG